MGLLRIPTTTIIGVADPGVDGGGDPGVVVQKVGEEAVVGPRPPEEAETNVAEMTFIIDPSILDRRPLVAPGLATNHSWIILRDHRTSLATPPTTNSYRSRK